MVNIYNVKNYCCEDPRLIENYEKAVNDKSQTWEIHHRLETDLCLTRNELIKQGKYYNRPAVELIFLTRSEHQILHKKGENHPMYGKHHSEKTRKKQSASKLGENHPMWGKHQSEECKRKRSESLKGEKNGMYGKPSPIKGKHKVWDNKELNKYHYE